jgi:L-fuconolactonase
MSAPRIDAHHHFWHYLREEYPWMSDRMDVIRRDFLPDDLAAVLTTAGIDGTVAVQARQTLEETRWLLDLADRHNFMRGVVGWVPLVEGSVGRELEILAHRPKLRAVRHVLHDEPDDFYMLRDDFNRGIALLKDFGLGYDLLIFERHLPQTIEFVDRHPAQVFVVDHIAKPRIREGAISPWRENLEELAKRPNVFCKLSGMVTEADWRSWTISQLRPYAEAALEIFGPPRLMFGSDWPVVLVAAEYNRWVQTVRAMISGLSESEQARILGGTAMEAYRL